MSKSNIQEHPSTILRKQLDSAEKRLAKLEKSFIVTEKVVVELILKNNAMKDQVIKLTDMISQPTVITGKINAKAVLPKE